MKVNKFSDDTFTFKLFSLQGQILLKKEFIIDITLQLKDFPKGLYMLTITGKSSVFTLKIIKN